MVITVLAVLFGAAAPAEGVQGTFSVPSQDTGTPAMEDTLTVEQQYELAREYAYNQRYEEAEQLLRDALQTSPDYHGIRVFLARILAWQGTYTEAREALERVLERDSANRGAHEMRITLSLWDDRPEEARHQVDEALEYHTTDAEFWIMKARIELALDSPGEALQAMEQVERLNPSHPGLATLRADILEETRNYRLRVAASQDRYSETFDPRTNGKIQVALSTEAGTVITRMNYADRFGSFGLMPEVIWYPSITDGFYAFINIAASPSDIFPQYRAAVEPYFRLSDVLEGSAGARFMRFPNSKTWLFTGSLIGYHGNWMFMMRPFFTPDENGVISSYNLTARRYYGTTDTYLELRAGYGFTNDDRFIQKDTEDSPFFDTAITSQDLAAKYSHKMDNGMVLFGGLTVSRQEKHFAPGEFLFIFSPRLGMQVAF